MVSRSPVLNVKVSKYQLLNLVDVCRGRVEVVHVVKVHLKLGMFGVPHFFAKQLQSRLFA